MEVMQALVLWQVLVRRLSLRLNSKAMLAPALGRGPGTPGVCSTVLVKLVNQEDAATEDTGRMRCLVRPATIFGS